MTLDPISAALGLAHLDGDSADSLATAVESNARAFLRGGGVISWSEWCAMSPDTRSAFDRAGDDVWRERAALIATACGGHALSVQAVAERLGPQDITDHVDLVGAIEEAVDEIEGAAA